jgi:hypothetical protein
MDGWSHAHLADLHPGQRTGSGANSISLRRSFAALLRRTPTSTNLQILHQAKATVAHQTNLHPQSTNSTAAPLPGWQAALLLDVQAPILVEQRGDAVDV